MKKTFLAWVLTVVLIVCMFPTMAFAQTLQADIFELEFGEDGSLSSKADSFGTPTFHGTSGTVGTVRVSHQGTEYLTTGFQKSAQTDVRLMNLSQSKAAITDALYEGFTLEAAFTLPKSAGKEVGILSGTNSGGMAIMYEKVSGQLAFSFNDGKWNYVHYAPAEGLKEGELYVAACVFDGSDKTLKLYVNGEQAGTPVSVGGFNPGGYFASWCLGDSPSSATSGGSKAPCLPNAITMARLYSAPMTAAQAGASYADYIASLEEAPPEEETLATLESAQVVDADAGVVRLTFSDPISVLDQAGFVASNNFDETVLYDSPPVIVNVEQFGADGSDDKDDTYQLQNAIDAVKDGGIVYFPSGDYLLEKCLVFYSNQTLYFEDEAVLKRNSNTLTYLLANRTYGHEGGYTATENVNIIGATFDGNEDINYKITMMNTGHCRNINLINCNFRNGFQWHYFECNSSENVLISGCVFEDSYNSNGSDGAEYLQFDAAYSGVYGIVQSVFGAEKFLFDQTVVTNVVVRDCVFDNTNSKCVAIGNHSNYPNNNITFYDNTFQGGNVNRGIINFVPATYGLVFSNNTFSDCGTGITMNNTDPKACTVYSSNTFENVATTYKGGVRYVEGSGPSAPIPSAWYALSTNVAYEDPVEIGGKQYASSILVTFDSAFDIDDVTEVAALLGSVADAGGKQVQPNFHAGDAYVGAKAEVEEDMGDGKVRVRLSGSAAATVGEEAAYTLSAANLDKLATVTVWFEVDGDYFAGQKVEGLNGFEAIGGITWENTEGSLWTGRVTIANMSGGVSSTSYQELLKLTLAVKEELGTTDVKITRIDLSGYDDDDVAVYFESVMRGGSVETEILEHFSIYDINRDGKVDQLDLTAAQLFYAAREGDANWHEAKIADVNGDGRVDIEDLIRILNNIVW